MPAQQKVRAACFTLFSAELDIALEEEDQYLGNVVDWPSWVRYCSWQFERCPQTRHIHIQGYAEFDSPRTFGGMKRWLPSAHFEARMGSRDQAREYTRKEESRVLGPFEHGSWSSGGQGARTDMQECARQVHDVLWSFRNAGLKACVLLKIPRTTQDHPRGEELKEVDAPDCGGVSWPVCSLSRRFQGLGSAVQRAAEDGSGGVEAMAAEGS